MLVLSRKKRESIAIGNEIEVEIVDIRPGRVRLGIKAPQAVSIQRREIIGTTARPDRQDGKS